MRVHVVGGTEGGLFSTVIVFFYYHKDASFGAKVCNIHLC